MPRSGSNYRAVARLAVLLICFGTALGVASAAAASGTVAATATATVSPANASGRVTGVPGTAVMPAAASGLRALGAAAPTATVTTDVFLADNSFALAAFATSVSKPGSDDYQHFLTPAQVQARFGPTPAQVDAVKQWLRNAGLGVTRTNAQQLTATGTTTQIDAAYDTTLERYSDAKGSFTAPSSAASVPAAVSGSVLSVLGLSSRQPLERPAGLVSDESAASTVHPTPLAATPLAATPLASTAAGHPGTASAPTPTGTPTYLGPTLCSSYYGQLTDTTDPAFEGTQDPYAVCGYTPSQMRSAYGVAGASNDGEGVTVAIVDAYSNPTLEADANTYSTNRGEPLFTTDQFSDTTTPTDWTNEVGCGGPAGWAGEQALDIEAVHGIAPAATVAYYGANSCSDSDFLATIGDIVTSHSADVITDSWGETIFESSGNIAQAVLDDYTQLFESAAAEGIEISFSTGDCGDEDPSTNCGGNDASTRLQPDLPDSDPWVTAVGGVSVEIGQSGTVDQVLPWGTDAWALSGSSWDSQPWVYGGGGGTSYSFAQPSYQSGVVPTSLSETELNGSTSATPMRVVPDLALDADPGTGLLIGFTQNVSGTTEYAEVDYGGTSLASPLFAGLVADGISQGELARGFLNPTLYSVYGKGGSRFYDDVVNPAAGDAPAEILAAYNGRSVLALGLGDDKLLAATSGYDDATGLGMPTPSFLSLGDTATTLTSAHNPASLSAAVRFTATVAPTAETGTPAGDVQFYIDGAPAGAPVALSGGSATSAPVSDLHAGTHAITAAYTGNTTQGFLPSTSTALSQAIDTQATELSAPLIAIQPHSSEAEISAALTRTDSGAPVPGQTVSFSAGGTLLCSATTDANGRASCAFQLTTANSALISSGMSASFAGVTDYLTSTASTTVPAGDAVAIPATTTLGSANATASLTLTCISNASGCSVTAALYARSGKLLGNGSLKLGAGRTQTVRLLLNRIGKSLTAGAKPLAGRLTLKSSDSSQANSYAVTVKSLKSSLLGAVPRGGTARAASVLASSEYQASFTALFAGRLSVTWYASVTGKGQKNPKLEEVAAGTAGFAIAGPQTLTIRLTGTGARLLRKAGRRRLIARMTFVPRGERAVSATASFIP
jgi:Pro-kumamolisin, activation domain/Bacterial Ig-like domain (group 3)